MSVVLRRKAVELINTREPVAKEEKEEANNLADAYESDAYGIQAMQHTLPSHCFKKLRDVIHSGKNLDPDLAEMVANGMKEWALNKGATHYTHWFQPMTGAAAEKHDSFINILPGDDKVLLEFSDIQLIKGEPDASSFPSGGLRSTWEARGYTVWDATSPAFIWKGKNGSVMSIPTAFCSWTGEALDQKTPLLRSMEALSYEAVQLLEMIGEKCNKVFPTLGIEQEFFLIDRGFYVARPDIVTTGRTLIGAKPPKGQEMEDHYFATMNQRIMACLQEVEWKMWKLGMPLKTRHNEVAPAQYEMAPIFERTNVASDHNIVLMETLRTTATRHNLVCLLHEKPFAGVNGSGKHNNWSMSTDTGKNLLEPGKTPLQNERFVLFLTAVIRAVDLHADLLRSSVANPGNDHRLGANEAPPAIISVYLGEQLDEVVKSLIGLLNPNESPSKRRSLTMKLGLGTIPPLPRDATDRNRTSPFAFTGNKFEFRAVGSSQSVSYPNLILNTIIADSIRYLRTEIKTTMEKDGISFNDAVQTVVQKTLKQHYRVVFNGDGYSQEWRDEAKRRGLPNIPSTAEALRALSEEKNLELFESLGVLTRAELKSRQHILFENYNKTIHIEAKSLISIAQTSILPAAMSYQKRVADIITSIQQADPKAQVNNQKAHLSEVVGEVEGLINAVASLKKSLSEYPEDDAEQATYLYNEVCSKMGDVRAHCDKLETIVDDDLWPLPKYSEMLFLR
jgi:glutamine synthetase